MTPKEYEKKLKDTPLDIEIPLARRVLNLTEQVLEQNNWKVNNADGIPLERLRTEGFIDVSSKPDGICEKQDGNKGLIEIKPSVRFPSEKFYNGNGAKTIDSLLGGGNAPEWDDIRAWLYTNENTSNKKKRTPINLKTSNVKLGPKIDNSYPIIVTQKGSSVYLYQLDLYLCDLLIFGKVKFVIWSNGLYWKIFTLDSRGSLHCEEYNLDPKTIKPDPKTIKPRKVDRSRISNGDIEIGPDVYDGLIQSLQKL